MASRTRTSSDAPAASPVARRLAQELGVDLREIVGTGPQGRIVRADVEGAAPDRGADTPATPEPTNKGTASPASPSARKLAEELGVDLTLLQGTGPGGRIVRDDVESAARNEGGTVPSPSPAPPPDGRSVASEPSASETAKGNTEVVRLSRIQEIVARRMAQSKATVPEFTIHTDIDMTSCLAMRAEIKRVDGPVAPSVNDFVVKAAAAALCEHPRVNASYVDGTFELYSRVNVGVAVASPDALIVPTVFDADAKPLGQIALETRRLAERARSGSITAAELAGGTFTVSNLGMFGVTRFDAVINAPQAAILAVGATVERLRLQDGDQVTASIMEVTLSCDHRILYGADAAQFLARIREFLEHPAVLLVNG